MIIDVHTHVWPEKVSQKAKDFLESSYQVKIVCDPTLDNLLSYMDKNGIDISVICAVATLPNQVRPINDWLFTIKNSRVKFFASLHPFYKDWQDELKRIKENALGIKFQPGFQDFFIDDEKVFEVYEKIEEMQIPVLFHCGQELSEKLKVRSDPSRVLKIQEKFSSMKIIAAHFGGFRQWNDVKKVLLGKNIYFDTSAFFGHIEDNQAIEMLGTHPKDYILFGTDFPLVDQKKDIDFLNSYNLDKDLKEKIFFNNAKRLFNL